MECCRTIAVRLGEGTRIFSLEKTVFVLMISESGWEKLLAPKWGKTVPILVSRVSHSNTLSLLTQGDDVRHEVTWTREVTK